MYSSIDVEVILISGKNFRKLLVANILFVANICHQYFLALMVFIEMIPMIIFILAFSHLNLFSTFCVVDSNSFASSLMIHQANQLHVHQGRSSFHHVPKLK